MIELFDNETMKKVQFFDTVDHIGHTNKVFSVRFDDKQPHILYSGGWDRNVVVWDIR